MKKKIELHEGDLIYLKNVKIAIHFRENDKEFIHEVQKQIQKGIAWKITDEEYKMLMLNQ